MSGKGGEHKIKEQVPSFEWLSGDFGGSWKQWQGEDNWKYGDDNCRVFFQTVILFYYTIDLSRESVPIQALEEFIDEYKHKYDIYFHKGLSEISKYETQIKFFSEEAIKWFSCKLISKTRVVNVLDANPKDIHFCLDEVRRTLGTLWKAFLRFCWIKNLLNMTSSLKLYTKHKSRFFKDRSERIPPAK